MTLVTPLTQKAVDQLRRLQSFVRRDPSAVPFNHPQWGTADPDALLSNREANSLIEDGKGDDPITVRCATSACVAGETVLMEGAKFVTSAYAIRQARRNKEAVGEGILPVSRCTPAGRSDSVSIEDYAQAILHLNVHQAQILFYPPACYIGSFKEENSRVWANNPPLVDAIDRFIEILGVESSR